MSVDVIRVQDREGRGPYRPGMSARWSDPQGFDCPPWWTELGLSVEAAHARMVGPYHFGCAFRTREQFAGWFTDREQAALDRLGYRLALVAADVIVADTQRQVVFGARAPLSHTLRLVRLESSAARKLLSELGHLASLSGAAA